MAGALLTRLDTSARASLALTQRAGALLSPCPGLDAPQEKELSLYTPDTS